MLKPRKKVALLVETSLGSGRGILRGIAKFARQSGDWQLFHKAGGLSDTLPDWIHDWEGDAIIARIQGPQMRDELEALNIPVVDVLGVCENRFPLVHVDNSAIAKIVAAHFRERNFAQFAYYGIAGENWSEQRGDAFAAACRDEGNFHLLNTPRDSGKQRSTPFRQLQEWVAKLPKPVAIMVCSDQRGLELLEACLSEGIAVPEQVAVVGVDNDTALCEISDPPLSSVRGGHLRAGFEAASLVDQILTKSKTLPSPLLVPPNGIVERESSQIRAIDDEVVARGVRFIRDNLAEPITNSLIAQSVGISRTLFQKRFRESIGQSIREYILEHRIARALHLITGSDFPLAQIADRCGFRHQEYLGQVIKKATGSSPGQIRKESKDAGTPSRSN
mgnify:CR=1 FL=1|tara:strand:+ start:1782 stop:2951 length:1170 start_codon:yes stop_codon:yes gene_type:complete